MSHLKNGESLKGTFSKWVKSTGLVFSTSLLMMTGLVGSASAAGYCCDPCAPDCCDMPDYVLYADFLYWQVHQEGLDFARGGYQHGTNTASLDQGKIYSPECEWQPGFRIGAMIDLGCCDWDFYAQYTWLNPDRKEHFFGVGDTNVEPYILSNIQDLIADINLQSVTAKYDLSFNVLDFGLGRTFNCNECFLFRPHFGFKATWQEHKYSVVYGYGDSPVTPVNTFVNSIHNKTRFDGIGLRAGFDAAWKFSPCFSIVGNFALSSVWSDLEITRIDGRTTTVVSLNQTSPEIIITNQKHDTCAIVPVLELFLGIRWDSTVCDCYDMFVKVGWENQVWFDTNRFIRELFDSPGNHGNLTFQGLTVGAGMGF